VTVLAKAMGLTKKEWVDLKNKVFISEIQKEELDDYFAKADGAAKEE